MDIFSSLEMLSWSPNVKTDLAAEGFVMDTFGHFNPDKAHNTGWLQRRDMFIESKPLGENDKWKREPVPFWGILTTDFDTLKKGNIGFVDTLTSIVKQTYFRPCTECAGDNYAVLERPRIFPDAAFTQPRKV